MLLTSLDLTGVGLETIRFPQSTSTKRQQMPSAKLSESMMGMTTMVRPCLTYVEERGRGGRKKKKSEFPFGTGWGCVVGCLAQTEWRTDQEEGTQAAEETGAPPLSPSERADLRVVVPPSPTPPPDKPALLLVAPALEVPRSPHPSPESQGGGGGGEVVKESKC